MTLVRAGAVAKEYETCPKCGKKGLLPWRIPTGKEQVLNPDDIPQDGKRCRYCKIIFRFGG